MRSKAKLASPLANRIIALPESRQLDVLASLFERRGAQVLRTPLISIHDVPDQAPVLSWLRQFIAEPSDYFIIFTGEGLRRLLAAADRNQFRQQFITSICSVCKICRGPKPDRVLREIQTKAEMLADSPTTAGVIETLSQLDLRDRRVAVQLYGEDPNPLLMDYLATCKLASCASVAPYVYASDSDNEQVIGLIRQMAAGAVDLIAFTSKPQVRRLFKLAKTAALEAELQRGLEITHIAAIGPVVKQVLLDHGCEVSVMPEKSYFMKPLVSAVEALYARA